MSQYGYKAVQTYYDATLWKTNAPPEVLYDLFKAHKIQTNKEDESKVFVNLAKGTPGDRIFNKPLLRTDIDFDVQKAKEKNEDNPDMKKLLGTKKQHKYFVPTEPNWGPKARAMGGTHKKQKTDDE